MPAAVGGEMEITMIREIIGEHPKTYRILLLSLIALLLITFIPFYSYRSTAKKNEKKAEQILSSIDNDKNISYVSIEQLEQLVELEHLKPATRGKIYRLMAEISYLSDDKSSYNLYVAHAAYYYQKSNCQEEMIALYSEYLGRLYENSGFDTAKELLERQNKYLAVSSYKNKETAVSYYLNYADVEEMRGDYTSASEKLELAMDSLDSIPEHPHYQRLLAKYHLLVARLQLLQGHVSAAQKELSDYHATDTLGLPEGNLYVYCDFTLPYHELMGKIALLQNREDDAISHIDFYLTGCDKSNFYMMEYRMLQFIMEHSDSLSQRHFQKYEKQFAELSDHNLQYLSAQYCDNLLNNIDQTLKSLEVLDRQAHGKHLLFFLALILLFSIFIIAVVWSFLLLYFHTDSLTRLAVRSRYEKKRTSMERRKTPYFLLILDIDDFKLINDNYGHASGDLVLRQIASIIKSILPSHDSAYRYGGEEICIIMKDTKEDALELAEKIRTSINRFAWEHLIPELHTPVTVSGGLAEAKNGRNPFQEADQSLYYSKEHGKNQITCR